MKNLETHFIDYIENSKNQKLHNNNTSITSINTMNNMIIYGPPGIGKYTYALNKIKTISPSNLKYEKKITFTYNKSTLYFKISDIHYEVDMSLLGCNSKLLWYEIYNQITDIISAKNVKTGIILCKYFNEIHNELLEVFYSYMQSQYNSGIIIKFIILTSDISFLPDNINNCCEKIILSRPSKSTYNKILKTSLDKHYNINKINNIKDIKKYNLTSKHSNNQNNLIMQTSHHTICNEIINCIINYSELKFLQLREYLYDICIFDLNIYNCIIFIIQELINKNLLTTPQFNKLLIKLYDFIKLYNNNYRPIYHLEKYILYIITVLHELS
tara:strand:+ start:171 stop:1154 length:984 start_codon:yes stop_codon:yes gene_type:complete